MKFYHGTNSLFLSSIKANGLGGYDPIKAWKAKDLGSAMWPYLEKVEDAIAPDFLSTFQCIVSDEPLWQHGSVYLTISEKQAQAFAQRNRYGSELLSFIAKGIDLLKPAKAQVVEAWQRDFPALFKAIDADNLEPLVVSMDLDKSQLYDEWGQSIDEEEWESLLKQWDRAAQYYRSFQTEFRLKSSECIPWGKLNIM